MRESSGLLLYHHDDHGLLVVLLGHMGGPLWARKDAGAWTIPKGEPVPGEDPHDAAIREFTEEIGTPPPPGPRPDQDLGVVRQAGGKRVHAWAREADLDVTRIESNVFDLVWPPRSGTVRQFPELDRAAWFTLGSAREVIIPAQAEFLDRLAVALGPGLDDGERRAVDSVAAVDPVDAADSVAAVDAVEEGSAGEGPR